MVKKARLSNDLKCVGVAGWKANARPPYLKNSLCLRYIVFHDYYSRDSKYLHCLELHSSAFESLSAVWILGCS